MKVCLALVLVFVGVALSKSLVQSSTSVRSAHKDLHRRSPPTPKSVHSTSFPEQWLSQRIDHLDIHNNSTWKQRFWLNDQWYQPGGPVFLMIGGESPQDSSWLYDTTLEWIQLAKKFNAMTFLLEHRFYGDSQPFEGASTSEQLKFLSSRQAILDVVHFVQAMNKKHSFDEPKWILFGGSYAGALAAWTRQRHPDLVYGAVASSATLTSVVDYWQYLDIVKTVFSKTDPSCGNNLHIGFTKLQSLMKTAAGRMTVKQLMNVCSNNDLSPSTPDNIHYFWKLVLTNYMVTVQYGGLNVAEYKNMTSNVVCGMLNDKNFDVLTRMANVNKYFLDKNQEECMDIDYEDYIGFTKMFPDSGQEWFWQLCTEFGTFQATDSNHAGPFFGDNSNSSIPIGFLVKECSRLFGDQFDSDFVYKSIKETNDYFGVASHFNATRVIFPNGSHDPWRGIEILKSPNPSSPAIYIEGTTHCADMYVAEDDPPSMKAARKQIAVHLAAWIYH